MACSLLVFPGCICAHSTKSATDEKAANPSGDQRAPSPAKAYLGSKIHQKCWVLFRNKKFDRFKYDQA
eukprot:g52414.t1